jgi:hypothetical protein
MAVYRGLNLPKILGAIFEHLHPADEFYNKHHDPIVACTHGASLAALSAAAPVSRLWFAVTVPILWQRPLEEALDDAAVPDASRRAFYAQRIRVVDISQRSPLWRALSRTPGAGMPGISATDMRRGAASTPSSCVTADSLTLPKLVSLCISAFAWWDGNPADFFAYQASLLWLVGPGL